MTRSGREGAGEGGGSAVLPPLPCGRIPSPAALGDDPGVRSSRGRGAHPRVTEALQGADDPYRRSHARRTGTETLARAAACVNLYMACAPYSDDRHLTRHRQASYRLRQTLHKG